MESRHPLSPPGRAAGLSLIELLVVLLIMAALIGTVSLAIGHSEEARLRAEAELLAAHLRAAREQAIVRAEVYVFALEPDGYRCHVLNEAGRLVPPPQEADPFLREHRFAEGVRLVQHHIEGATLTGTHRVNLVFEPSGALPAFRLVLASGTRCYRVWREPTRGKIQVVRDEC